MNSNKLWCDEIQQLITNAEHCVSHILVEMSSLSSNLEELKKYMPVGSPCLNQKVAHAIDRMASITSRASDHFARLQLENATLQNKIFPLVPKGELFGGTVHNRTEINAKIQESLSLEKQGNSVEMKCVSDERESGEKRRLDWDAKNKEKVWLHKKEYLTRQWLSSRLPQEFLNSDKKHWLVASENKSLDNTSWEAEELHKWLKKMVLPEESQNTFPNLNEMDFQCCDDGSSVSESIGTIAPSESSLSSEFSVLSSPNNCCNSNKWLLQKNASEDNLERCGTNVLTSSLFRMDIEDLDSKSYLLNRQRTNMVGNLSAEDRNQWLVKRSGPSTSVYSIADSCIANEQCADFSSCLCDENCLKMAMLRKIRPVRNKNRIESDELAAFRPYRVVSPIIDMLHTSSKQYLKRGMQHDDEKQ